MISENHMKTLIRRRDSAQERRDLAEALRFDDQLEDLGLAADDRITCYTCQSWCDHAHHPLTGRRISVQDYRRYQQGAALGQQSGPPSLEHNVSSDLHEHADPRVAGGRYHSAYWGIDYTVDAISFGPNGFLEWITVTDKDGTRTHGTAWDPRDRIVFDPRQGSR